MSTSPENQRLAPEIQNLQDKENSKIEKTSLEKLELLNPELKGIAAEISEISGTWNPVELYTASPESVQREKAAFFEAQKKDETYNPHFDYPVADSLDLGDSPDKIDQLLKRLGSFEPANRAERVTRVALRNKIKDDQATTRLIKGLQTHDDTLIGAALRTKYSPADDYLLRLAEAKYRKMTLPAEVEENSQGLFPEEEKQYMLSHSIDATRLKHAFEWGLEQFGILKTETNPKGFAVVVDEKATSIDVRDKSENGPTVFVPVSKSLTVAELLALMEHEICGHARQSMNAQELFGLGGGALKVDDETLYEGLAMRYENAFYKKYLGIEQGFVRPVFYPLAADMAERGASFQGIFNRQMDMQLHVKLKIAPGAALPDLEEIPEDMKKTAQEQAWLITYRVMRGHTDTSNQASFAMNKDVSYLRGIVLDDQLQAIGKGHFNEAAAVSGGGLQLVSEFDLKPEDLPYAYKEIAPRYWQEFLEADFIRENLAAKEQIAEAEHTDHQ
jgi:hypothetical protein